MQATMRYCGVRGRCSLTFHVGQTGLAFGNMMIDIGMHLKSDEVVDLLELHDLRVEYHFDRLHEGEPDSYTVESEELSLALRFDSGQRCTTIFIQDPQAAIAQGLVSFPDVRSPADIIAYGKANAVAVVRGPSWLRCDGAERCIHYEFEGETLKMVTLMSPDVAPQRRHEDVKEDV